MQGSIAGFGIPSPARISIIEKMYIKLDVKRNIENWWTGGLEKCTHGLEKKDDERKK